MEPPGPYTDQPFYMQSHFYAEVGFIFLVLLLILSILHSFTIRHRAIELEAGHAAEDWSFKNRLSVFFFQTVTFILLSGLVYSFRDARSLQGMVSIWLALATVLVFTFFIPFPFIRKIQRAFDLLAKPVLFVNSLIHPSSRENKDIRVKELEQVLENSDSDSIEEDQRMLQGIMKFSDTEVRMIMTRSSEVISVSKGDSLAEILETIRSHGYSRLPVFDHSRQTIVGVIHSKDLLPFLENNKGDWYTVIRPAFFVAESRMIIDLLEDFQQHKKHMAIATATDGKYSGLISMEDIIEEIVGDISDEFDDEEIIYSKLDDHNYIFEAKIPLAEVARIIDQPDNQILLSGQSSTIAGLLMELTNRVPVKNEKIAFHQFIFTVEASDKRRLKRVKLTIQP